MLSTTSAGLAGVMAYTKTVPAADAPQWPFVAAIYANIPTLAFALLGLSGTVAVLDLLRSYLDRRHQEVLVLDKILNDFSRTVFRDNARRNRVTLFKATAGWRIWIWGLVRLPLFAKLHKWLALWSVSPRGQYLGVYLRPADVRNRKSCAAFRISDVKDECEGVAGLVWESGGTRVLPNLPIVDRVRVKQLTRLDGLDPDDPIRRYADATNMLNMTAIRACDSFARHYLGTLIRSANGEPWGVLLLDSEDDVCPFMDGSGNVADSYMTRFQDYARILGKIVR